MEQTNCNTITVKRYYSLYSKHTDMYIRVYWYMYVNLLIHICKFTDTCMRVYWYMYVSLLIHVCEFTDTYMWVYWYMYASLLIHICEFTDTCMQVYWYIYVSLLPALLLTTDCFFWTHNTCTCGYLLFGYSVCVFKKNTLWFLVHVVMMYRQEGEGGLRVHAFCACKDALDQSSTEHRLCVNTTLLSPRCCGTK